MSQDKPRWGYIIFLILVVGLIVFFVARSNSDDVEKAPAEKFSFVLGDEINEVPFGSSQKEVVLQLGDPAYVFKGGLSNSPKCISYDVKESDGNTDVFLCFKNGELTTKEKSQKPGVAAVVRRNGSIPFN